MSNLPKGTPFSFILVTIIYTTHIYLQAGFCFLLPRLPHILVGIEEGSGAPDLVEPRPEVLHWKSRSSWSVQFSLGVCPTALTQEFSVLRLS